MQIPGAPDLANPMEPASPACDPGPHWQLRYWSLFLGQSISLIGSALTQFVLLWWITETTGSVTALATAGMAALLPHALLSPIGGIFADRYSRRLLMAVADLISALCMIILIALFISGKTALWHVYTMMFVRSAMQAFQEPAAAASEAMLVPREFLPRAAGLNQTMLSVTTIAAAPIGAIAISALPMGWALSIDVFTALLGVLPLVLFNIPQERAAMKSRLDGIWAEFHEGLQLIWNHRGLRSLYGLLGIEMLIVMPSYTLVPLLIKEHFSGGPAMVAFMEGLAGIGMLLGGILVTLLAPRRKIQWILWGFAASCGALALTGLAPANMFGVAVAWWVISGATFILGDAPLTALLQTVVPNRLQGRAFSLLNMVMGLAAPIGLALATPLGDTIGVRWLFVVMGVLGATVSIASFFVPALLRLDRIHQI